MAFALLRYAFQLLVARKGLGMDRWSRLALAVLAWQTCWGITNESFAGPIQAESVVFFVILGLVTARLIHGTLSQMERAFVTRRALRPMYSVVNVPRF